jgi:hypothetical protein
VNDQRSTTDQLRDAVRLCNEAGLYDAADYIARDLALPRGMPRGQVAQSLAQGAQIIARRQALQALAATQPRRLSGHPCDHCGAGEKEWCRDECEAVDEGDWR